MFKIKMNETISIVIPTYNRFKYLLNTLKSVKEQTYKNISLKIRFLFNLILSKIIKLII